MTEIKLTQEEEKIVINRRKELIKKANERVFFFGGSKARLAGSKLKFPILIVDNTKVEITWQMAEQISTGFRRVINSFETI